MTQPLPPNAITWFEIPVTDLDRSTRLYNAMLDIELRRETFFGIPHAIFVTPERSGVGGALIVDSTRSPSRTGTWIYLYARDGVERALARAVEAGATVVMPATSLGEIGTIGVIQDFDGNHVGLHTEQR